MSCVDFVNERGADLMPYASLLVYSYGSLTYCYGDAFLVNKKYEQISKNIKDDLNERANIWLFANKEDMLLYIKEKRAYHQNDQSVEFIPMVISQVV